MMPLHVHNQHVPGEVKRELDELVTDHGHWEGEIVASADRRREPQRRRRHNQRRSRGGNS